MIASAAVALVAFVAQVAAERPSAPTAARAATFPWFVRVDAPIDPAARALLEAHGVDGYLVRATDQASLEALRDRPVLVEGLLPPGNLRLSPEELDRHFEAYFSTRDHALTRRPSCFHREPVRTDLRTAARTTGAALRPYAPLLLLLVHDPSITVGSEPFDWCYCDACRGRFREVLAERVSREPALAAALGEAGVDGFEPWTVDEVRARNLDRPRAEVDLFPWLAWRRFLDGALAAELATLGRAAREASGSAVGFSGGAPSNPFGGHDWSALARAVEVLVPPDDPTSREVAASFLPASGTLLTSLRSTGGAERVARQKLVDQALSGSTGVLCESLTDLIRPSDGAPGGRGEGAVVPAPLLAAAGEVLATLRGVVLPAVRASTAAPPEVAILYSPASLDVLWLKDSEPDGVWWPSRSGRRGRELLPLAGAWWGWQLLLEDVGVPYRYVDDGALARDDGLEGVRVLVLPRAIVLSDAAAARVRAFATQGGLVLADRETGLFDELGRGRSRGVLDDLLQIQRDDEARPWDWHPEEEVPAPVDPGVADPAPEPPRVLGLRVPEPDTRAGAATTLIARAAGRGRTVYLNLDLSDYIGGREQRPDAAADLRDRVRGWLADAGVASPLDIARADGSPLARVKVWRFVDPLGRELVALRRNEVLPEMRGKPEAGAPETFVIRFGRERQVLDLLTGAAPRRAVAEHRVVLGPADLVFLALR